MVPEKWKSSDVLITGSSMEEYPSEVKIAVQAALDASLLCQQVQKDLTGESSFTKSDRSPVTVADYGAQAIICKLLKETFPKDLIIAEEDSVELRKPDHAAILAQVMRYVEDQIPGVSPADVCEWIGSSSRSLADRSWVLDPIDGTAGFLRGDQYAIALALVEKGEVTLGVLACPNLYADIGRPGGKKGCLFLAVRGEVLSRWIWPERTNRLSRRRKSRTSRGPYSQKALRRTIRIIVCIGVSPGN